MKLIWAFTSFPLLPGNNSWLTRNFRENINKHQKEMVEVSRAHDEETGLGKNDTHRVYGR